MTAASAWMERWRTARALGAATETVPLAHLIGLGPGSVGNTVKELQRALIAAGVPLRGDGYDFSLDPEKAYSVEETWEAVCRAASAVEAG